MLEEGPPIWTEVKYGTVENVKKLPKVCTAADVSAPGGRHMTSQAHESVWRVDLGMFDRLRYNLCDLQYKIISGPFKEKTPRQFAEALDTRQPYVGHDIQFNICREEKSRVKRKQNRALFAAIRNDRKLFLAFAGTRHERLGQHADAAIHNAPDEVMQMIFVQMNRCV
ncbi:hypothetical protein T484DRAFT_1754562 [Baffinella frigidus]|nr:hypothetical protein T484DRAFT_1754562 [Cryptophyta sp. CCMP2293]